MENFNMPVLHTIMWRRKWRRKRRNMWGQPINIKRPEFEIFSHFYWDLLENVEKFHGFFRMNIEQFYRLSQLVGEEIWNQNTSYRRAITPQERLAICLGTCYKNLETRKIFSILLELPFFLISVIDSNIIYSYLHFISSIIYIYIYIYIYNRLCLFCSTRIVRDIRTQDLLDSLSISFKESKYQQRLIFVFSLLF